MTCKQIRSRLKSALIGCLAFVAQEAALCGAQFHVAINGSDSNSGSRESPFRTIQHAADGAQPGDIIIVHQGIYRERINPPRGGTSDAKRIVYQAASDEIVEIKGSEIVSNWVKVQNGVWKVTILNSFFGSFNPYCDVIHGDWFNPKGRVHHTGAVYLNGDWLTEAASLDEVLNTAGTNALWFGQVDKQNTTIWAQFQGINPNRKQVEINVRQTMFYPKKTNINYLTVRGFTMSDTATPWAPPTAEQIGLIGTHWSKGWIIESNIIRYSICSGIALGKYGDEWDNKSGSAEGYIRTIKRALTNGWSSENIGHHIVRNNTISHCEQAGIVGSLGAVFSIIISNNIHDIHVKNWFSGAEMAAIKLHGAVDVQICHNHIHRSVRGIWLDWMAQGTRVTCNLFHDNQLDIAFEVDHGPFLVDNNLFLSPMTFAINSQGGAFVHNLFAGVFEVLSFDGRQTPFFEPHSTKLSGVHNSPTGDVRFYNNLFVRRPDLSQYNQTKLPVWMEGSVFLDGAMPCCHEKNPLIQPDFNSELRLVQKNNHFYLQMKFDKAWASERMRQFVTSDELGKAVVPNLPYEQPNGMPIRLDTDCLGEKRDRNNPFPGPFEIHTGGRLRLKIF